MSYARSELQGAELVWLLTLTLRGRVYRYAESPRSATDGSYTRLYLPGLSSEIRYLDAIPAPGQSAEEPGVNLEVRFSRDTRSGWSALAAGDADLGDATGELALWIPGTDLSRREVWISGPLTVQDSGGIEEPVQIGIRAAPWRSATTQIPVDAARVAAATWPADGTRQMGDGLTGTSYPLIVGAPGYARADALTSTYPAAPALLVGIDDTTLDNSANSATVLIGDGLLTCVGSASVKLHNATTGATSAALTPATTQDNENRTVTILSVTAAQLAIDDGDELWAVFTAPATAGLYADSGATLRRASDVIPWLLRLSGARYDRAELRTALARVQGYFLDGYLNSPVDPIEILLSQILPLLPLTWRIGAQGLEILPWPYDATHSQAVARLDTSTTAAVRVGSITRSSPDEVVNLRTIQFCLRATDGAYLGTYTLAPSRRVDQPERETSPYSLASEARYGTREGAEIQTAWVVDVATARRCLLWRLPWEAQTRETVTYQAPQDWQFLRPGQIVSVTDAETSWSDRLCYVASVLRGPGPCEITLTTIPDWIRDGAA